MPSPRIPTLLVALACLAAGNRASSCGAGEGQSQSGQAPGYYVYPAYRGETDDGHCCRWFGSLPPAPAAPVVSTIPALMLAQPAVPVSHQFMSQAVERQLLNAHTEELAEQLETMLRQAGVTLDETPSAAATGDRVELERKVDDLEFQLRELQTSVDAIQDALQKAIDELDNGNPPRD